MSVPKRRKKRPSSMGKDAGADPTAIGAALAADMEADNTPTLMCNKDKLPKNTLDAKVGRKNALQELVMFRPDSYRKMIGMLALGVTQHAAAEFINIQSWTFYHWMDLGMKDLAAQLDTFHSRLVYDVRKAIAYARTKAEIEVRMMDPLIYLQRGSARLLGDEWRDNPNPLNSSGDTPNKFRIGADGEAIPDVDGPLALPNPDGEVAEDADFAVVQVGHSQMNEALAVLVKAGLITINDQTLKAQIIPPSQEPVDETLNNEPQQEATN
jgi:hypothetical protein